METYYVYDSESDELVGKYEVMLADDPAKQNESKGTATVSYLTLSASKYYTSDLCFTLIVHAYVYTSGSFRQINSITNDHNVTMSSTSYVPFEWYGQQSHYVGSSTGNYPTTSLDYSFSGTLRTTATVSYNATIQYLVNMGFSGTQNSYYYLSYDSVGQISLY